jgi:hypothetical protein
LRGETADDLDFGVLGAGGCGEGARIGGGGAEHRAERHFDGRVGGEGLVMGVGGYCCGC